MIHIIIFLMCLALLIFGTYTGYKMITSFKAKVDGIFIIIVSWTAVILVILSHLLNLKN